jgi:hypothetical protein
MQSKEGCARMYSYLRPEPDIESDPHVDDVGEDEDEVNSEENDESSSEEENFEIDE